MSGSTTIISAGQSISGVTLTGGTLTILSGGSATDITLGFGEAMHVSSGGRASLLSINSGSEVYVSYGATVSASTISAFGNLSDNNGSVVSTVVKSHGYLGLVGGIASDTTISSGGFESIYAATDSSSLVEAGGTEILLGGTVYSAFVASGGYLESDGGGTSGVTIAAGGLQVVQYSAVASASQVYSGGLLVVEPVGAAYATSGAGAVVSSGVVVLNRQSPVILNPATAVLLTSGGVEYVLPAGSASNVTALENSQLNIFGGSATNLFADGGQLNISGGTTYDLVVANGGRADVGGVYEGTAPAFLSDATVDNAVVGQNGALLLNAGGTLTGSIDFAGSGGAFIDDAAGSPFQTPAPLPSIMGFMEGDTFYLPHLTFDGSNAVTSSGDSVTVSGANGESYALSFIGDAGQHFVGGFDSSSGGTELTITAPCFLRGTRIRTPDGDITVEDLRIGDIVTSFHHGPVPVKWIGRRAYSARFAETNPQLKPIRIAAGALAENSPARDLLVSPDHALCIAGHLIHAALLVNGVSIRQETSNAAVFYYHIELARHDVIYAENCAAESFLDENCRQRFHNAAEFENLYPADARSACCLPRLSEGFALQAIRDSIARRAGIPQFSAPPGPLRGRIDEVAGSSIRGWAQDIDAPEQPVSLLILAGAEILGRVLANAFRPDLHQAGLGSGRHGFSFKAPRALYGEITIHREEDGAALPTTQGREPFKLDSRIVRPRRLPGR